MGLTTDARDGRDNLAGFPRHPYEHTTWVRFKTDLGPSVVDMQLVVGAVIVDSLADPRRVLATRRSRPEALKGRWEFPGGKVEVGEAPDAALIREVQEELGVTLMLGEELAPSGKDWPISDRLTLRIFLAEIFVGTPKPGDSHDEVRWLSADDLESVDWLDADREAVSIVADRLPSGL